MTHTFSPLLFMHGRLLGILLPLAVIVPLMIGFASAEGNTSTTSSCPNPDAAISACKQKNMDFSRSVGPNGCTVIECKAMVTPDAKTTNTNANCPQTIADISAKAAACKAQGLQSNITFDSNTRCYMFNACGGPLRTDEVHTASASSSPSINSSCPSTQDMLPRILECQKKGGHVDFKTDGAGVCKVIVGCILSSATNSSASAVVMCKKQVMNRCINIMCEDGFQWNSCKPITPPMDGPILWNSSAAGTMTGPCTEVEKALQQIIASIAKNPTSVDLQQKLNYVKSALEDCRKKNIGSMTSSVGISVNASVTVQQNCTYTTKDGCATKTCDGKVIAKRCASSSSSGNK